MNSNLHLFGILNDLHEDHDKTATFFIKALRTFIQTGTMLVRMISGVSRTQNLFSILSFTKFDSAFGP